MIEDKWLLGEFFHQLHGNLQVLGKEQQIIGQFEVSQLRDATAEVRAQHEIVVGFVVHDMAHAYELGMGGEPLQLVAQVV